MPRATRSANVTESKSYAPAKTLYDTTHNHIIVTYRCTLMIPDDATAIQLRLPISDFDSRNAHFGLAYDHNNQRAQAVYRGNTPRDHLTETTKKNQY